jgi:ribose 5-phosphate isomerase B
VSTDFTGETRHSRRIDMLTSYEKSGKLPPLPDEG